MLDDESIELCKYCDEDVDLRYFGDELHMWCDGCELTLQDDEHYTYKDVVRLEELEKAIQHFGGQAALAQKLGLRKQQIHTWVTLKKEMPLKHAVSVEAMSGGKISALLLKPSLLNILREINLSVIGKPVLTKVKAQ